MSEILYKKIREFNKSSSQEYQEIFKQLSAGQKPDAIFIGCSDSRVMPSLFSKSDPGELFMVRNVGNLIPKADPNGVAQGDESEGAAIEYALEHLLVDDIVICGHSSCGAMAALLKGKEKIHAPNLKRWLRHADEASSFYSQLEFETHLCETDKLSQANVLLQLENIKTYPIIKEKLKTINLKLHAWWIDIETSKVYTYDSNSKQFKLIT
jgi:carbonic anhydrase